jgi:hypothetical protein
VNARCGRGCNGLIRHVRVHFVAKVVFVGGKYVTSDFGDRATRDGNGIALTVRNGVFKHDDVVAVSDKDSSGNRTVYDVVGVGVAVTVVLLDPGREELQDVAVDQIIASADL